MLQYISPLSFLPPEIATDTSAGSIKLARQKLMAEFELAGTTTIPVGGRELSRNDILKLFDRLNDRAGLAYHKTVASEPVLLRFLERNEIVAGEQFYLPEEVLTPEFKDWISPYFAWSFNAATVAMFRAVKPEAFETLILCPSCMNNDDSWDAWAGVEHFMYLELKNFKEFNGTKNFSPTLVDKYAGYNFVWLLCNMPEDRFSTVIDDYAFELMQLAIRIYNNKQKDKGFEIMGYARSLHVSQEMMQVLMRKEEEMKNIQKQNNKVNWWSYVRIGLFALYVLSRLATCNG